jgi:hypothetical protein
VHDELVFDKILVGKTRPLGSVDPYLREIAQALDRDDTLRQYLLEATNETDADPVAPTMRIARK